MPITHQQLNSLFFRGGGEKYRRTVIGVGGWCRSVAGGEKWFTDINKSLANITTFDICWAWRLPKLDAAYSPGFISAHLSNTSLIRRFPLLLLDEIPRPHRTPHSPPNRLGATSAADGGITTLTVAAFANPRFPFASARSAIASLTVAVASRRSRLFALSIPRFSFRSNRAGRKRDLRPLPVRVFRGPRSLRSLRPRSRFEVRSPRPSRGFDSGAHQGGWTRSGEIWMKKGAREKEREREKSNRNTTHRPGPLSISRRRAS
jgi:hypothetical protein